jgi:YesN/AraC family two-component response regulator
MKMMKFVTRYTYDDIVSYLLYLSYLLYMKANEQEARGYEKLPVDFSSFTQEIMACETLEEVDAKFTELLSSMTAIVREKKFKRKNALAEKILDILETGYTNVALCQEGVADELNVSRDYVGRIFKMTYGQTFGECLNEIRLNKASELLAQTKKSITEITEEVGWENKNYFYTSFKAKFGMTTSEYRTNYGP